MGISLVSRILPVNFDSVKILIGREGGYCAGARHWSDLQQAKNSTGNKMASASRS